MTILGVPVTIRTQSTLAYLIRKQGITLGHTIFLRGHALGIRPELLAHEFCHTLQVRRLGALRFAWAYVSGLVRHGYGLKHPLEREAYDYAVGWGSMFHPYVQQLQRVAA